MTVSLPRTQECTSGRGCVAKRVSDCKVGLVALGGAFKSESRKCGELRHDTADSE